MSDSRASILSRVRGSSRWIPEFIPAPASLSPGLPTQVSADRDPWRLAERFALEAKKIDCEVWVEHDIEAATQRLQGLLAGAQVLSWDLPFLKTEVARSVEESGGAFFTQKNFNRGKVDIGLTACDLAVAETGSVVLSAGPGKPREASLIGRVHVALVDPSRMVADLSEALARVASWGALTAAHVNIISGPSRTADIEMTLTRGVHGPKRVVWIVAPWLNTEN